MKKSVRPRSKRTKSVAPRSKGTHSVPPRSKASPLLAALRAAHAGDFSVRLQGGRSGVDPEIAQAFNLLVARDAALCGEISRIAESVGREGKLTRRASVPFAGGDWSTCVKTLNRMIADLVQPTIEVARVIEAVAKGDLSRRMPLQVARRRLRGDYLQTAETVNQMVEQLGTFGSEVTRVAREVGIEGKLGGQAKVKGVAGAWKDLTDNVNLMAANLTSQVRNIAEVTTAVAKGDLSKKITVAVKGEILELKNTVNTMVDQLNGFASEVTRVAREVGTEGRLGGQAKVKGVAGTWKDLTEHVNSMADNLTSQVRNIAEVTTAVARGDLTKKITVEVKGEILQLKDTINTLVDQLNAFASEVTRVAREVGTEGKLGGRAHVEGVAGTWKGLTESVNSMAENLTSQVRNIVEVTAAVARGDLTKKISVEAKGEILELKNTVNTMVEQLNGVASEVTRVAKEVGTDGRLGGQAFVRGVHGTWKDLTSGVNSMAENLTSQVRNIAEVTTAVAKGDLSRKITVDVKGEVLELKNTINTMVDQLNAFASEVTRVAGEVGTEGKLGGQAKVKGVAGTWKDLTDNVNSMADNLTAQVRGIAMIVTAVANGDLKRKLVLDAKGEIAVLADTINEMIDTLAVFAVQVTQVAREVGVEGRLGGQAQVPGAAGTWRDLTDNVNQLAANLTTQVRAIAEVATAVTEGDLSRSITVAARGEVAVLKDTINEMIGNLKETTQKNTEQDWLNSNLARIGRMLQGQRDLQAVSRMMLSELALLVQAQHGVFYVVDATKRDDPSLVLLASYACKEPKDLATSIRLGEGLVGQCALERERILLTKVPPDYVHIGSGLGEGTPLNIIVLPILFEGEVRAVIELASFEAFSDVHLAFLEQLMESIGIVLHTIGVTMRTEELLRQSQSLTERLRAQQEQLQRTNDELEDKAEQLAQTSRYKSEFLANMSHELRTPLNSLLILSRLLADNQGDLLSPKQVEYAETIYSSGRDLLGLINEILDLSKVESGTMGVEISDVAFGSVSEFVEREFRPVAEQKRLAFSVTLDPDLPPVMRTDAKRLQQVLRNLLANAFKFTVQGEVSLRIERAAGGWSSDATWLDEADAADAVIGFSVSDTGIGIQSDKQEIIFEAFQQADGTTSRKYGGTGLGLSISREIARILGGEVLLTSQPDTGSTFTLFLPRSYGGAAPSEAEPASPQETVEVAMERERDLEGELEGAPVALEQETLVDDRDAILPGDRVLLIIEDDARFAGIVQTFARERGFLSVISLRGDWGLALARRYRPMAIILDICLPGLEGWTVLDRLKHDPATRHIPVHVVSVTEEPARARTSGAQGFLVKPVDMEALVGALDRIAAFLDRPSRRLLLVEPDAGERERLEALLRDRDVEVTTVATEADALEAVAAETPDCIVFDVDESDMPPTTMFEWLRASPDTADLPVIVYTGGDLDVADVHRLERLAGRVVRKDERGLSRLLDAATLYLHRAESGLPEPARRMLQESREADVDLEDRKVLIVDDDMRNVFALTSILEQHRMHVAYAENGRMGIAALDAAPDTDVVLMDIMMPEMDGYETIRRIRMEDRFRRLPIIAVTANAMRGDREKCLEAGASDYIPKPVDVDQLLSLLRVWLYR